MTPAFIAPSRFRSEHATKASHHERDEARPLQTLIVNPESARVFRKTDIDQPEDIDVIGKLACARHGEVVVLHAVRHVGGDADALPDKKCPDREHLQLEPWPAPERHVASMPGYPVDKKEDVATFLVNHRLESFDEFCRKEARRSRRLEQSKREEAVDAFAVAGHEERPFG